MWAEALLYLPSALHRRRPVSARALKIALAVNRWRVANPQAVWRLGDIPWGKILFGSRKIPPAVISIVRDEAHTPVSFTETSK